MDSGQQWLEIQKKQQEANNVNVPVYDARRPGVAVLRDLSIMPTHQNQHPHQQPPALTRYTSGYTNSGLESEAELTSTLNRVKKKQNLKTMSESGRKDLISREIKKHIAYDLVDPEALNDKRDIRFTNIE